MPKYEIEHWKYSSLYIEFMIEHAIKTRREWITEWYGERCKDFEPGCLCCQLWKNLDEFEAIVNGTSSDVATDDTEEK